MPIGNVIGSADAGKTTLLVSIAQYEVLNGREPTIPDLNPDQNAASFYGAPDDFVDTIPKTSEYWTDIRDMLEGDNPDYPDIDLVAGLSPVTENSVRWNAADPSDPIVSRFSRVHEGVRFMQTGTFNEDDRGAGCIHGKMDSMNFLLNRMRDGNGEDKLTLIDNAHGRDVIGLTNFALGDVIIIPTTANPKSRDILVDYLKMVETLERDIEKAIPVIVVGNKLPTEPTEFAEDMAYIREVAGDKLIAGLVEDRAFARKRSNAAPEFHEIAIHNQAAIEAVYSAIWDVKRDYELRVKWQAWCLDKAKWLDKIFDASVRQQPTDFVPDDHGHVHGPGCGHSHAQGPHNHEK